MAASNISLDLYSVNINGHECTQWADDTESLSLPSISLATIKRGPANGFTAVGSGIKGGPVFKFMPTSPSVKFFQTLVTGFIATGISTTFAGLIRDTQNNITVALINGHFTDVPTGPAVGTDAKNMEYTIEFKQIVSEYLGSTL